MSIFAKIAATIAVLVVGLIVFAVVNSELGHGQYLVTGAMVIGWIMIWTRPSAQ